MDKITTPEMELALAHHFNYLQNLIVPGINSMDFHECDLLIITQAGCAWEVEIKVSASDLVRDKKKFHGHESPKIKYLYFAIPWYLLQYQEHIPERAGIITVEKKYSEYSKQEYLSCDRIRKPMPFSNYKFTDEERYRVARLGAIRMWTLRDTYQEVGKKYDG